MTFLAVPVGILLASAGLLVLFNRKKLIGASWLVSLCAAVGTWGWTFLQYRKAETSFLVEGFSSRIGRTIPLTFIRDSVSWPYMMALSALLLLLLLTAPSGISPEKGPRTWCLFLLITAVGFIAVTSKDVYPLIFCWIIFDTLDLVSRYFNNPDRKLNSTILVSAIWRMIGTLIAAVSIAVSLSEKETGGGGSGSSIILLTACALRMGILPLSELYADADTEEIGLYTMLRLVSVLTVMPILSRVSLPMEDAHLLRILSYPAFLSVFVGALGWFLSADASRGNTYAAMSICGMSYYSMLRGQQSSLIVWGVSIVFFCAPLSLYRIRNRWLNILPLLCIFCFSGLPYMPTARGWFGLVDADFSMNTVFFIFVMMLLLSGGLIHTLKPGKRSIMELEPWMRTAYPLGFVFSIGSQAAISLLNWNESYSYGVMTASFAAVFCGILFAVLNDLLPRLEGIEMALLWIETVAGLFWKGLKWLLDLHWLTNLFRFFSRYLEKGVSFLTQIFAGHSGLVWEILLLILVIAAAFSGGVV